MRVLIASDWHLGHSRGSARAARLALAFLDRVERSDDQLILNGDIFEGLFEPVARAEAAHPEISARLATLAGCGRLQRTAGNHDPGAGPAEIVLEHVTLGRVLVTHGHTADPVGRSRLGRLGDGISLHLGWFPPVRGAAHLVSATAHGLAGPRMERIFSERCRRVVDDAHCALGIFGHVHRPYLVTGDRYANAGALHGGRLEYLVLAPEGASLEHLDHALDGPSVERLQLADGPARGENGR